MARLGGADTGMRLHREVTAVAGAHAKGFRRTGFDPLRRWVDGVPQAGERVDEGVDILRQPRRLDRTAQAAENALENALRGRRRRRKRHQQAEAENPDGDAKHCSFATGTHHSSCLCSRPANPCEATSLNVRARGRLRPLWGRGRSPLCSGAKPSTVNTRLAGAPERGHSDGFVAAMAAIGLIAGRQALFPHEK